MPTYEVSVKGSTYEVDAPDENTAWAWANKTHDQAAAPQQSKSGIGDFVAGAVKGASDIGATLLTPIDAAARAMGIQNSFIGRDDRRQAVKDFLVGAGADPESWSFKGGELAAAIAGTAGAGGAMAKGAATIPALVRAVPALPTALGSAGMRLGNVATATGADIARNAATRIAGGAITGGVSAGMVNPDDTLTGVVLGGALPIAARITGELGKAAKAAIYDPRFNQQRITAGVLQRAVGTNAMPSVLSSITTRAATPGVNLSAGQATLDPALNAIEDALKATNAGGALNRQAANQRQILADAMRGLAQDDVALGAATQARKAATSPLYQAAGKSDALADTTRVVGLIDRIVAQNPANKALVGPMGEIREGLFQAYPAQQRGADAWNALNDVIGRRMSSADSDALHAARVMMDRVRKGTISAEDALSGMQDLTVTSKTAGDAINLAREYMKTPGFVVRQKPNELMSAIDNIKSMLGRQENAFVRGELNTVKRSLEHQLSKAAPEFRQAERMFSGMSRPINQMQVGQYLANKFIPSTAGDVPAGLNAASLATALRNPDQVARTATGFRRATLDKTLTPDQLAMVRGVSSDASRIAEANKLGAGVGSPTARRMAVGGYIGQHMEAQAPVLSNILSGLGGLPGVNYVTKGVSALGSMAGKRINDDIALRLEEALANDPAAVQQFLLLQPQAMRGVGLLGSPVVPAAALQLGLLPTR